MVGGPGGDTQLSLGSRSSYRVSYERAPLFASIDSRFQSLAAAAMSF